METPNITTAAKILALTHLVGLSPRGFTHLLERFGDLDAILEASPEEIQQGFEVSTERAAEITEASARLFEAQVSLDIAAENGSQTVTLFDNDYPSRLKELNDPPPLLFYSGSLPGSGAAAAEEKVVAFVGSSSPSAEGIATAVDFGQRLAGKNVAALSGLAPGIDSAVLLGVTSAGGVAHAALASGLDNIYPEENSSLAEEIASSGSLFCEYLPATEFDLDHLAPTNRLLVALSQAVVVGEVFEESAGTLDLAENCIELGKILFVLITESMSESQTKAVERLINSGAIPISFPDEFDTIISSLV